MRIDSRCYEISQDRENGNEPESQPNFISYFFLTLCKAITMVKLAESEEDIAKCLEVLLLLRPHLSRESYNEAIRLTLADNRKLIFVEENGKAVSALVFEWGYNLYRGRYIYIDDLSSLPEARGKGYASELLDWVIDFAKENGYN